MRIPSRVLLRGIATYVPGVYKLTPKGTGGTVSARYCYSVWLRHLTLAHENGLSTMPEVVAELGPGDSIGTGLAALICGAKRYYALDIVKYTNREENLSILDELTDLFMRREAIPDTDEFPEVKPYLASYAFPHHILTRDRLSVVLNNDRVRAIRSALLGVREVRENEVQVSYFAPWSDPKVVRERSVDMIVSQAVLEHVDDLSRTYQVLHRWLKPGGFLS